MRTAPTNSPTMIPALVAGPVVPSWSRVPVTLP